MGIKVFASHDWGTGGATHSRVKVVVEELRRLGFEVWFDETHMKGNILDAMCKGIDSAEVVLVFLTRDYIRKVGQGGDGDNVRREFLYASRSPDKLLPVRLDQDLPPPSSWSGPVGMLLGSRLYVEARGATLFICTRAFIQVYSHLVSLYVSHQNDHLRLLAVVNQRN